MDHFQALKQSTIQNLFENEYIWMKSHRWALAETQSTMLLLLDGDKMSLHHLNQVRQWMAAEEAQKAKAEEDAKKKTRDPSQLTGGYTRQ